MKSIVIVMQNVQCCTYEDHHPIVVIYLADIINVISYWILA